MKKTIEAKEKTRITNDWLSAFPDYKKYKPMWLIKRNGPFLFGINLELHSGKWDYQPVFHMHNLMVDFPHISICSGTNLKTAKNTNDMITVLRHENEFELLANLFKSQIPLMAAGDIRSHDLIAYIKGFVRDDIGYPFYSLMDIVLALFWYGYQTECEQELENMKKVFASWPDGVLWKRELIDENGLERYLHGLMNRELLERTVLEQISKLKLEKFTDYGLIP
jgi:hypothetical protein